MLLPILRVVSISVAECRNDDNSAYVCGVLTCCTQQKSQERTARGCKHPPYD